MVLHVLRGRSADFLDCILMSSMIANIPIVVNTKERAMELKRTANSFGYDIPTPLTVIEAVKVANNYNRMYVDGTCSKEMIDQIAYIMNSNLEVNDIYEEDIILAEGNKDML